MAILTRLSLFSPRRAGGYGVELQGTGFTTAPRCFLNNASGSETATPRGVQDELIACVYLDRVD